MADKGWKTVGQKKREKKKGGGKRGNTGGTRSGGRNGGSRGNRSVKLDPRDAKQQNIWKHHQRVLKQKLKVNDEFNWELEGEETRKTTETTKPTQSWKNILFPEPEEENKGKDKEPSEDMERTPKTPLKLIAGADISFFPSQKEKAVATIVVCTFPDLKVVHEISKVITLTAPYIAGFLAFREAPSILALLKQLKEENPEFWPQLLLVDGNGMLHYEGFGLACHLGVLTGLPTCGVAKNLLVLDGLTERKAQALAKDLAPGEAIELVGTSGTIHGAALRATDESKKPIYVSIGHKISLETCVNVVRRCCNVRVPEPVRQADLRSRQQVKRIIAGEKGENLKKEKKEPVKDTPTSVSNDKDSKSTTSDTK